MMLLDSVAASDALLSHAAFAPENVSDNGELNPTVRALQLTPSGRPGPPPRHI